MSARSIAFTKAPNFLVINPDECIDCDDCVEACPAGAIFNEDDLPEDKQHFLEINEELSQIWLQITDQKDPLPDAAEMGWR